MKTHITRRKLLRYGGLGSAALIVAACQPKVVEKIVEKEVTKEVEKVVKETVIVQGTPQVVEKLVTVEASTPAPKEKIKLSISWWGPPDQTVAYEMQVQDYHEKNPHVEFEIIWPGQASDYVAKILTLAGAGETPDVILTENTSASGGRFGPFAAFGALGDLTDRAAAANITKDQYVAGSWEGSSFEGKLYGIPYVMNAMTLYSNLEMLEAKGLPTPRELDEKGEWTYDKFLEYAQAFADVDNHIYGFAAYRWACSPFIWMFGGQEISDDGTKMMLNDPKTVAGFEAHYHLMTKYNVMPTEQVAQGLNGMHGMFTAQQSPFYIGGNWDLNMFWNNNKFRWENSRWFSGPAGLFAWTNAGQWCMSSQTKYPEEAWEVLQTCTSDEGLRLATVTKLGRTPAKMSVVEEYYYRTWPDINVKAFVDMFPYGRARPFEGTIATIINSELDLHMEGKQTVQQALDIAQAKAQAELEKGDLHIQTDMLKIH